MADVGISTKMAKPIFVVGAAADTDLLTETLADAAGVLSADTAAPDLLDSVPALHPAAHGWDSGRLTGSEVTPAAVATLTERALARVRDRDDRTAAAGADGVVLECSPMHALRIPFLAAAFPDARFVYVQRSASESVAAALGLWQSQRAVAYPGLPGWIGSGWTGPLVAEWRDLRKLPLHDVVAVQWKVTVETALHDLECLPADRWAVVAHERLVADPQREIGRLCAFLDLDWDRHLAKPLVGGTAVVDSIDPATVAPVLPIVADVAEAAADLIADDDAPAPVETAPAVAAFESRHTTSFPQVLSAFGVSLLVSTYQSGRVILCRADGDVLNTHYRALPVPMGIAVDATRIVIGTERRIVTYRNHPSAVPVLGDERYDGCFLPLDVHVSGNIQVHELAYVKDELWAVSTRFSSLVTFDGDHSFVPRWRPPFVSALAADDRCHLNGFAAADDRVAFATALAVTDTPGGWRDGKGTGGVLLDVASGEVFAGGLSMPHSPRWYDGRLWVLESGKGSLSVVDPAGRVDTVVELPGFTRGLAFAGPYAFVGLSEVRESVFPGLPIVQRHHRECGVWIVDIRDGSVMGYLAFTGAVQEIFDVQVLPMRWPEIGELDGELHGRSFVLPSSTTVSS